MLKMNPKNVEEDEIDPVEEKKNSRVREIGNSALNTITVFIVFRSEVRRRKLGSRKVGRRR